jgi:hypothetical protein
MVDNVDQPIEQEFPQVLTLTFLELYPLLLVMIDLFIVY